MVYSLVNAPTLIRDLARLPAGPALVVDLLQVFALTPPDLDVLDAQARRVPPVDPVHRRSLVTAAAAPRALALLAAVRSEADVRGLAAYTGSVDVLAEATIGGLEDMVRFVRTDVLRDAWSGDGDLAVATHPGAFDVVADGLVATYVGSRDLGRAWRRWCAARAAPSAALGYPLIVDAVRQLDPTAAARPIVPAGWAELMHEACWAVHLSGRERTAAVAQLLALRALVDVMSPAAPGHALVATVVAAVQAAAVSDLLGPDVYTAMTEPFFRLLP